MDKAEQPVLTWKKVRCEESFARTHHASVLVNNYVFTIGGMVNRDWVEEIACYNLKDQTYQILEYERDPLPPVINHTACYYQDRIIVFGGENEDGEILNELMALTINMNENNRHGNTYNYMSIASPDGRNYFRSGHTANIFENKMCVFGGSDDNGRDMNDLLCLDLDSNTWEVWRNTGINPEPRQGHCSVLFEDNLFIFGGYNERRGYYLNDLAKLNLKTKQWQRIETESHEMLPSPRTCASLAIKDNQLYLFGGTNDSGDSDEFFSLDLNDNTWKAVLAVGDIPPEKSSHTSLLYENQLIILGGSNYLRKRKATKSRTTTRKAAVPESKPFIYFLEIVSKTYDIPASIGDQKIKKVTQDGKETYFSEFRSLLFSKKYSDVAFEVENEVIPAHKNIVATRCRYFENMFTSGMMESQAAKIRVPNIKVNTYKALLEFLYCNEITLENEDLVLDLLMLCDEYSLPKLKDGCEEFLSLNTNLDNLVERVNLAENLHLYILQKNVTEFVFKNLDTLQKREDFYKLPSAFLANALLKAKNIIKA